jgi:hypothetical protein
MLLSPDLAPLDLSMDINHVAPSKDDPLPQITLKGMQLIVIKSAGWIFNVYKLIIMMSDKISARPLTQGKPVVCKI